MEQNEKKIADSLCASAFTIFCGVCGYDDNSAKTLENTGRHGFSQWKFHVNPDGQPDEKILNVIGDFYYESLVSSIFPGYTKTGQSLYNSHFAGQTRRYGNTSGWKEKIGIRKGENLTIKVVPVEYLDLFLFPGAIAIYAFKCNFEGCTYDEITFLVNYIRNKAPQEFDFIRDLPGLLSQNGNSVNAPLLFGNKLKSFTLVEQGEAMDEAGERNLLYDLATCSPVGSASGEVPYFQPTQAYFNELWEHHTVNVFDNWKAMCLFDSFTGLFRKEALSRYVWENAYFNLIFLHSVYVKHYLFSINRRFFLEDTGKQQMEDEFYEFDNYFNFRKISYNFLPQIIYEKIRHGFDIEEEMEQMQSGIGRANAAENAIQDRRINKVLTIIAFLTVFSVILDASDLVAKIIFESDLAYQVISGTLGITVLALISFLLFRKRKSGKKA